MQAGRAHTERLRLQVVALGHFADARHAESTRAQTEVSPKRSFISAGLGRRLPNHVRPSEHRSAVSRACGVGSFSPREREALRSLGTSSVGADGGRALWSAAKRAAAPADPTSLPTCASPLATLTCPTLPSCRRRSGVQRVCAAQPAVCGMLLSENLAILDRSPVGEDHSPTGAGRATGCQSSAEPHDPKGRQSSRVAPRCRSRRAQRSEQGWPKSQPSPRRLSRTDGSQGRTDLEPKTGLG